MYWTNPVWGDFCERINTVKWKSVWGWNEISLAALIDIHGLCCHASSRSPWGLEKAQNEIEWFWVIVLYSCSWNFTLAASVLIGFFKVTWHLTVKQFPAKKIKLTRDLGIFLNTAWTYYFGEKSEDFQSIFESFTSAFSGLSRHR